MDQGVDLLLAKCFVEGHQLVEITVVGIRPVDAGARAHSRSHRGGVREQHGVRRDGGPGIRSVHVDGVVCSVADKRNVVPASVGDDWRVRDTRVVGTELVAV